MNEPAPTSLPDDSFLVVVPPRRKRPWWLRGMVAGGSLMLLLFGGCVIFSLFCRAEHWEDNSHVLAVAHQIMPLELPHGYVGEVAEVIETPMFDVRKAIFRHESGKGTLAVTAMEVHWSWLAANGEGLRAGLDQLAGEMRSLIGADESKQEVMVNGSPVEFTIRTGQDALSSTKLHEVRAVFPLKHGMMAEIWWQAEAAIWTLEAQEQFLQSLSTLQPTPIP